MNDGLSFVSAVSVRPEHTGRFESSFVNVDRSQFLEACERLGVQLTAAQLEKFEEFEQAL